MGVGITNKIFLEFDSTWWPSDWEGANFVWRNSDLIRLKSTKYYWIRGVVGLYPVQEQPNTLQAIIHGKHSVYMEYAKDTDLSKGVKYLLKHFLNVDQKPRKITVSKYATDPNARGSHSYHTISAEMFGVNREDLASAVYNSKG